MSKPQDYAVVGNPIHHSQSPRIHQAFAEQTGEAMTYRTIEAPIDDFARVVRQFFSEGGGGLNVTVPFKQEAWQLADRRAERAELAGAVNTLWQASDGALVGDNTDGVGLVRDITQHLGWVLKDQRILILGAGGAVRGILQPLLAQSPARVTIANRTLARAEALCQQFAGPVPLDACGFEQVSGQWDLIINGTSASLSGDLPPVPDTVIGPDTRGYDMMYGAETTVFNCWLQDAGAVATADGLGMLVEQAAEAFQLWRGVAPETGPVLASLREALSAAS